MTNKNRFDRFFASQFVRVVVLQFAAIDRGDAKELKRLERRQSQMMELNSPRKQEDSEWR